MTQTKKTIATTMDTATTHSNEYRKCQLVASELHKHSGDVVELAKHYDQAARDARRKWIEATHPAETKSVIGRDPREHPTDDSELDDDWLYEWGPWRSGYWNVITWLDLPRSLRVTEAIPVSEDIPILADIWNGYDDHYRLDLYFDANDIDVSDRKVVRMFLKVIKKKVDDGLEPLREAINEDIRIFYGLVDKVSYREIPDQSLVVFSAKGRLGLPYRCLRGNVSQVARDHVLAKSDYRITHDSREYTDNSYLDNEWVIDYCTCPEQKLEAVTPADKWLLNYLYENDGAKDEFETITAGLYDRAPYDGGGSSDWYHLYSQMFCHNDHYYLVSYFDIDGGSPTKAVEIVANIRDYLALYGGAYDLSKPEVKVQHIWKNRLIRVVASGEITPMTDTDIEHAWTYEL